MNNKIEEHKDLELIKTVDIENDEVVDTQFYGDILDDINISEREQYQTLMNTFLSRKDRRKLAKYKGFKTFSDKFKK